MRLLVAQEESGASANIERRLLVEGFDVDNAVDGETALWRAREGDYAAIILDVLLPKMNGYDVCQLLRDEDVATPILMLTAKSGEFDEVEGFECGADDFMRKPFSYAVLIARIRALLRRERRGTTELLSMGAIRYDPSGQRCWYIEQPVELTGREAGVMEALLRARGEIVSKNALITQVWGMDFGGDPNIADVYIGYLRRKLSRIDKRKVLKTVRGLGYRLLEVND